MWKQEFVNAIRDQFQSLKTANPDFSVRTFAKKLDLSPGFLSELIRGKGPWKLTAARARQLVLRLDLPAQQANRLLVLMGDKPQVQKKKLDPADYDAFLTDWAYTPILTWFELSPHLQTVEEISSRLGLTPTKVQAVIDDLLNRNLLERLENGHLRIRETYVETTDGPTNEEIRLHHLANLQLAQRGLEIIPAEQRYFTSITCAGSRKRLQELVKHIQDFMDGAPALIDSGDGNDEVYQFSVNLFPYNFGAEDNS